MKTSTIVWIVIIIVIIVGLGWYFTSYSGMSQSTAPVGQTTTSATTSGTPAATGASATSVAMVSTNATLGSYLVAANGMTLYTYSPDSPGVSNCTGQCAVNWPPYTVPAGTALSATGATGQLATLTRADGTTQLTYNGAPVYFYIKDTKAGDTNGQGVGGIWYVVKP